MADISLTDEGNHVLNHANNIRQVRQHQHGKRHVMQSSQRLRQLLVSSAKRRKRAAQPKLRSTTQRRGSSTKPRLASGSFTIVQLYAMFAKFHWRQCRRYSLINKGDFD